MTKEKVVSRIVVTFNDKIKKEYEVKVNWPNGSKKANILTEDYYYSLGILINKITQDSNHKLGDINNIMSTINKGVKEISLSPFLPPAKAIISNTVGKVMNGPWEFREEKIRLNPQQSVTMLFNNNFIDHFGRLIGIGPEDKLFGTNDEVDLTGALSFTEIQAAY